MIDLTNDSDDEDVDRLPYVGVRQQVPLFAPESRDITFTRSLAHAAMSGYRDVLQDAENNLFSPEEQKRDILQRHYEINPYGHHELFHRNLGPLGALHYAHAVDPESLDLQRSWILSRENKKEGKNNYKGLENSSQLYRRYKHYINGNILENLHDLPSKGRQRDAVRSELGLTDMHQLGNHQDFLDNEKWYYETHPEAYMYTENPRGVSIIEHETRQKYRLPHYIGLRKYIPKDIPDELYYHNGYKMDHINQQKDHYRKQHAIAENYQMGREDSNRYRTAEDNAEMERRGQIRMEKRRKQEQSLSGSKRKYGKGIRK
jgi:hypothetical protein